MPRPTSVVASTPLGEALERHRVARGMTRRQAYRSARTSETQWRRLLTDPQRRFEPELLARVASAVGMDLMEALALAKVVVIPDDTERVLRESEVELLMAS